MREIIISMFLSVLIRLSLLMTFCAEPDTQEMNPQSQVKNVQKKREKKVENIQKIISDTLQEISKEEGVYYCELVEEIYDRTKGVVSALRNKTKKSLKISEKSEKRVLEIADFIAEERVKKCAYDIVIDRKNTGTTTTGTGTTTTGTGTTTTGTGTTTTGTGTTTTGTGTTTTGTGTTTTGTGTTTTGTGTTTNDPGKFVSVAFYDGKKNIERSKLRIGKKYKIELTYSEELDINSNIDVKYGDFVPKGKSIIFDGKTLAIFAIIQKNRELSVTGLKSSLGDIPDVIEKITGLPEIVVVDPLGPPIKPFNEVKNIVSTNKILEITKKKVLTNGVEIITEADMNNRGKKDNFGRPIKSNLHDKDHLSFKMNELFHAKALGNGKFNIKNYLPHEFKGIGLFLKDVDSGKEYKIAKIENFPGFSDFDFIFDQSNDDYLVEDDKGNQIRISKVIINKNTDKLKLTLRGDDPMLKKIQEITIPMTASFLFKSHRNAKDGKKARKQVEIGPQAARDYIVALTNIYYLFSSKDFEGAIKNTKDGYRFFVANGGKCVDPKDGVQRNCVNIESEWRDLNRQGIINNFREEISIGFGLIGNRGATLGVASGTRSYSQLVVIDHFIDMFLMKSEGRPVNAIFEHKSDKDLKGRKIRSPLDTMFHELGHVYGYTHQTNLTYSRRNAKGQMMGLTHSLVPLYNKMMGEGRMPFLVYPY